MHALRLLLLVLTCSLLASCVGAGFLKYHQNETTREFDQDLGHAWLAVLEAMDQLGYGEPVSKELRPLEGAAEYVDSADRVHLRLESQVTGGTRLIVRVGKSGSKTHRRKALVILGEVTAILDCDEDIRAWTEKVQELSEMEPAADAAEETKAAER